MKKDIQNEEDTKLLVDTFYVKVKANNVIGHIFNDVAKVNWDEHLPIMYAFWNSILLGSGSYSGNPMDKHIQLSKQTSINQVHFTEWLSLFNATVDELFEGVNAEEAKIRAQNIARIMLYKIENSFN
jgi:hemoglobin